MEKSHDTIIKITVGSYVFLAKLECGKSPKTAKAFKKMLPFASELIHARWSGQSCWIPLGDLKIDTDLEDATSYPSPGEILFYPGGISETEILFPYGSTQFASKAGQLAGNHFLTIFRGKDELRKLGEEILWKGAKTILFEEVVE